MDCSLFDGEYGNELECLVRMVSNDKSEVLECKLVGNEWREVDGRGQDIMSGLMGDLSKGIVVETDFPHHHFSTHCHQLHFLIIL